MLPFAKRYQHPPIPRHRTQFMGWVSQKGEKGIIIYLEEIRMRPLRAIEQVFLLALLHFRRRGVRVRVGHSGQLAVFARAQRMEVSDEGGEGGGEEDVARILIESGDVRWKRRMRGTHIPRGRRSGGRTLFGGVGGGKGSMLERLGWVGIPSAPAVGCGGC